MIANNIITLTTDFGVADIYVGQMKGAIIKHNPRARIIDLTHNIMPQQIQDAAFKIFSSYHHFPRGTTHLIVVDPDVGGNRPLIAVRAVDHFFICPDNGILSFFLQKNLTEAVFQIQPEKQSSAEISATFHGRDIMAPTAARLAAGTSIENFGPEISPQDCVCLPADKPIITKQTIKGHVRHIDHFGNIQTNISAADFPKNSQKEFNYIDLKGYKINRLSKYYSGETPEKILALMDSSGYLEIAINKGNAAKFTKCALQDGITIYLD